MSNPLVQPGRAPQYGGQPSGDYCPFQGKQQHAGRFARVRFTSVAVRSGTVWALHADTVQTYCATRIVLASADSVHAADQLEMKCKGRWRIGLAVRGRLGSSGDQARPDPGRRHRVSYGGTTGTNTAERGPAVGVASAVRWAISVWRSSSAMR